MQTVARLVEDGESSDVLLGRNENYLRFIIILRGQFQSTYIKTLPVFALPTGERRPVRARVKIRRAKRALSLH